MLCPPQDAYNIFSISKLRVSFISPAEVATPIVKKINAYPSRHSSNNHVLYLFINSTFVSKIISENDDSKEAGLALIKKNKKCTYSASAIYISLQHYN